MRCRLRIRMRRRKRHRCRWRFRFSPLININLFNLFSKVLSKSKVEESNEFERKVKEIYELLPKQDCGACGYESCYECARAIAKGEATLDTCKVLKTLRSRQVSYSKIQSL
ncbi:MAG TPA: hypothetical protein EYH00_03645 [Archaeoglobus profundus]|nr:hypothetical protein [Archaeoglobus profundus]